MNAAALQYADPTQTLAWHLERSLTHSIDTRNFAMRIQVIMQGSGIVSCAGHDLYGSLLLGAIAVHIRQGNPNNRRYGSSHRKTRQPYPYRTVPTQHARSHDMRFGINSLGDSRVEKISGFD